MLSLNKPVFLSVCKLCRLTSKRRSDKQNYTRHVQFASKYGVKYSQSKGRHEGT